MITLQRCHYLTELGGGFSSILQYIEGARKAPPDLQRTLYLSNDFGSMSHVSEYSGIYRTGKPKVDETHFTIYLCILSGLQC